jgi:hypothetical protein
MAISVNHSEALIEPVVEPGHPTLAACREGYAAVALGR